MIRINLMEEDRLGEEPQEASRVEGEAIHSAEETPESATHETDPSKEIESVIEETPKGDAPSGKEDEPQVKIPRSKQRHPGTPPKKRQPQDSPLSRGPSTGIIIFLLVVAIGVTIYFMFFNTPKEPTPVPVAPDTTAETVQEEAESGPAVQEEPAAPVQKNAPRSDKDVPGYLPQSRDEIQHAVGVGKKKLESAYRLLSNVQAQSQLSFLSIGNQHLTMAALTNSRTFANRVRRQITNTSIVRNIELFDVQGTTRGEYRAEVNVYGNLKPGENKATPRDFRSEDIGKVRRDLKEWIAIPTIELTQWKTKQVSSVDGWDRGPVFIQMTGTQTGIIRVIHALKNHGYNFSVSKIYVYTPRETFGDAAVYTLKLYLTLFGEAGV